jgi:hypothetical protein
VIEQQRHEAIAGVSQLRGFVISPVETQTVCLASQTSSHVLVGALSFSGSGAATVTHWRRGIFCRSDLLSGAATAQPVERMKRQRIMNEQRDMKTHGATKG